MPDDVAIAGKDGRRLARLIDAAERAGSDTLYRLTEAALGRLLPTGPPKVLTASYLFTPSESAELAEVLAAVVSTGDLLGRTRVRELMGQSVRRFADTDTDSWQFLPDTAVPVLTPTKALDYFRRLVPTVGITDPARYGQAMQRAAFTLARMTEQTVLRSVQDIITRALQTGQEWQTTPATIQAVLRDAGVHPTNPQYSQMVFRTNAMDAFVVGQQHEVNENPEVASFFPAWQYLGIRDGREGDDHRPHFGLYYPASRSFHSVRGERVFNCRCGQRWVDRNEWARLQSSGVGFSNV